MDAIKYVETDKFLQNALDSGKFARGLVPVKVLRNSTELVKFLQRAVSAYNISEIPKPGSPLDMCYRNGWLQAELAGDSTPKSSSHTVYVFASSLHRR